MTHLLASERELLDPGFRQVYAPLAEPVKTVPAGQSRLARLQKGERITPRWVRVRQRPPSPAGLSEAALIQAMQAHGIGRPSTYADTLHLLVERGYAVRQDGRLIPTELGHQVCAFLVERFGELFDLRFTARMETQLDDIASGRADYHTVVSAFWSEIQRSLDKTFPPPGKDRP